VLLYPRIQARYQIAPAEAAQFVGRLAEAAHLIAPVITLPIVVADPNDDPVLYTAADGKADVLCTLNNRQFTSPQVQPFGAERSVRNCWRSTVSS